MSRAVGRVRPRVRDSVLVFRRGGRLQFVHLVELRVKEFDVLPFVVELVPLLDGTRTREELHAELSRSSDVSREAVEDVLDHFAVEHILDRVPEDDPPPNERYSRQAILLEEFVSTFDHLPSSVDTLQRRLLTSTVAIVGVGGIGSWVLQSLTAVGVGRVVLLDPDTVDSSNLNRQILYRAEDVGRAKVDVAAERCRAMNPDVEVLTRRRLVETVDDLADVITSADVVAACGDHPDVAAVSDVVAAACGPAGVAHVVGGAYGGNLGIPGTSVVPGRTVCWPCIRAATRGDHARTETVALMGRRRSGGSIAPVTGIVSNLMAWEVVKMLLGLPLALSNQVRELDILGLDWRVRPVASAAGCPCGEGRSGEDPTVPQTAAR